MSRRTKIIIIACVILAVLLIAIIVWSIGGERIANINQPVNSAAVNANINASLPPRVNVPVNAPPAITKEPATQATLIALSMTFAEKFGSFSTESNYENLKDLKSLMTDNMISWAQNYMDKNKLDQSEFYGVTSKAISANIINLNDEETKAQIVVNTQRQENNGKNATPRIFYQKLLMDFIKVENDWKVDKATWQ